MDVRDVRWSRRAAQTINSLGKPKLKFVVVHPGIVETLEDLAKRTYDEVYDCLNTGPVTCAEIEKVLAEHGLTLSGEKPKWWGKP